ncbi:protein of unknown function DUF29 [Candidatus Magnetoovum chiemensis]|nr:protein of unknown function DUF29 [Candidatus Magnetoovum chiemensis]
MKYSKEIVIEDALIDAKIQFEKETGISKKTLPEICPYTWEQLNDFD